MVHSVDQREILIDIARPPPVVDSIINKVLIGQANDRCLFGRKLAIDELYLRFLEHLRQFLNRSQRDIHSTEHCLHHGLLTMDGRHLGSDILQLFLLGDGSPPEPEGSLQFPSLMQLHLRHLGQLPRLDGLGHDAVRC